MELALHTQLSESEFIMYINGKVSPFTYAKFATKLRNTLNNAGVPTQVVTLTQVVTSDNLGLTQVITMVPADPSGNFLPQIRYAH